MQKLIMLKMGNQLELIINILQLLNQWLIILLIIKAKNFAQNELKFVRKKSHSAGFQSINCNSTLAKPRNSLMTG